MTKTLKEIAQDLIDTKKKIQLIYAFNGTGKTRLSREFKRLVSGPVEGGDLYIDEQSQPRRHRILYYNAFTEDLFYWDHYLGRHDKPKLKIQPNSFTDWILKDQGQDRNIISNFQRYANERLTPRFNEEYLDDGINGDSETIQAYSEVTFSLERGDDARSGTLKISKGEESNFIWSIFYTLLEQVMGVLSVAEPDDRETNQFDQLEYVFIDDPVSSLDENHLIELAVDIAQLIKRNRSEVKFVLTTHNPLFYNVLHNELAYDDKQLQYKPKHFCSYRLVRRDDGGFSVEQQSQDSPFSYHLFLKAQIELAIESGQVRKYHFNFLRNILEKTSTFLGYKKWGDLLPRTEEGKPNPYEARIINISSHSKHAGDEVAELTEDDKRVLKYLVEQLNEMYRFGSGLRQ